MKKLFVTMVLFLFTFLLKAQENNPYNQVGVDYIASIKLIKEDYNQGKLKDFTKEALEEYSSKLPSKVTVDMDMAANVLSAVKEKKFDFVKSVNESKLSDLSKVVFIKVVTGGYEFNAEETQGFLVKKVEEIKKSNIDNSEKEFTLAFIAISYNLFSETSRERECVYTDDQGHEHSGTGACIIVGAGFGYWVGNEICGLWCGVGGAIIGGIAGALS
jgi:hypothetical protein